MKKAKEYLNEIINTSQGGVHLDRCLFIVKQIQEDAIRETVKECAENAELDWDFVHGAKIDKNSILSIADKLIKKL